MRLLILAALKNKKHFFLAISTVLTLFILTIANQSEMGPR
jgi:hypothetical protein